MYLIASLPCTSDPNISLHRGPTRIVHVIIERPRGDSSISRMPGCGSNVLPKNWIVSAVSSLYLNNLAS